MIKNSLPKTKLFKYSLIMVTIEAALMLLLVGLALIMVIGAIIMPNAPGTWDGLGDVIMIIAGGLAFCLAIPVVLTVVFGHRYIKGESKNGSVAGCLIPALISLVVNWIIITFVVPLISSPSSFSLKDNTAEIQAILFTVSLLITEIPLLAFIVGCLSEKGYKSAKYTIGVPAVIIVCIIIANIVPIITSGVGVEKISPNDVKLDTLGEFNQILRNRGFVYDIEPGKSELTTYSEISAVEPGYEYERFYKAGYNDDMDKKFSFYTYEGYVSLIEKSPETADYYSKGPEDWWISWHIYDSNGQIFAAVSEESKAGEIRMDPIFRTSPIQIVSEKGEITTYNWKGNYFVKGGCLTNTRVLFPEMHDSSFGNTCGEVYVVDRVDAVTLDRLARKIVNKE